MKILQLVILIYFFQFTNCYNSTFPIANSDESTIDDKLIGSWVGIKENDSIMFPFFEVDMLPFNDNEYIALAKTFTNEGRIIKNVEIYKVFSSFVKDQYYLNISPLNSEETRFIFYKVGNIFSDSIHLQCINDTLKLVFNKSGELKSFMEKDIDNFENNFLSNQITFFKWNALTWNKINKLNHTDNFKDYYEIRKAEEQFVIELSDVTINELFTEQNIINIDSIKSQFERIHLSNYNNSFWKAPYYGIIKLNSGKLIKMKFDRNGNSVHDLTNDIYYMERN